MFRVLRSTDEDVWLDALAHLPVQMRDVHFTPAYAHVQEQGCDGEAMLAVLESEYSFIIQPFMRQRIGETGFSDIKSLYGFGGPIGTGSAHDFDSCLTDWALRNFVVSEYCVLNPMLWMHQLPLVRASTNITFTKDTVVIDLFTFDLDKVERRVRRGVRRAQKDYSVIEIEAPCVFDGLYRKSMDRLGAANRWRFGESYWQAHDKGVDARWFFVGGTTEVDPSVRRGLLTIGNGVTAYAHFLGSDGEARDAGLDELLYYGAAKALHKSGYLNFHLGGGLTERDDDPLLFFKAGFSPLRYRVGSYRRIFDPLAYNDLTVKFAAQGADPAWFPAYRAYA